MICPKLCSTPPGRGPSRCEAPTGVLYNIVQQPATGRTMIHFLNYTLKPSGEIKVVLPKKYTRISLLSPDSPQPVQLSIPPGAPAELKVPSVRSYSLLVMENGSR